MSNTNVPIYTTGNLGLPSENYTPTPETIFVSSYTGNIIPQPTYGTPHDSPVGPGTYHGGLYIGNDIVMCHNHFR